MKEKKSLEAVTSFGTAIVVPVCFVAMIVLSRSPAGWPFFLVFVGWFVFLWWVGQRR
jgi:hypothetical protein